MTSMNEEYHHAEIAEIAEEDPFLPFALWSQQINA